MRGNKGPGGHGFIDLTKEPCKFGFRCNKRDTCPRIHPDTSTGMEGNTFKTSGY
jgi:hypothetical protein